MHLVRQVFGLSRIEQKDSDEEESNYRDKKLPAKSSEHGYRGIIEGVNLA
jgi:hypothetical protein